MPEIAAEPQKTPEKKSKKWKGIIIAAVVGAGVVVAGVSVYLFFQADLSPSSEGKSSKTASPAAKNATGSAAENETENWKTHKSSEYKYSLKYPKSWNESTDTKVVSAENNIVYHFFSAAKEKDQTSGTTDEVMIIRYLEGDPCAGMEIKRSDTTLSGYKSQRSDCFENGKLKVILFSFVGTSREEWFLVAYIDKELERVEEIISNFRFLD